MDSPRRLMDSPRRRRTMFVTRQTPVTEPKQFISFWSDGFGQSLGLMLFEKCPDVIRPITDWKMGGDKLGFSVIIKLWQQRYSPEALVFNDLPGVESAKHPIRQVKGLRLIPVRPVILFEGLNRVDQLLGSRRLQLSEYPGEPRLKELLIRIEDKSNDPIVNAFLQGLVHEPSFTRIRTERGIAAPTKYDEFFSQAP